MAEKDIRLSELVNLSYLLWEKNKEQWSPMSPEYGKIFLLWMIEEIGEVISIIKKKTEKQIVDNIEVRNRFVEEMCDVLMYYIDVLNRFGITVEEFSEIYMKKFNYNMNRDYKRQYDDLIVHNEHESIP